MQEAPLQLGEQVMLAPLPSAWGCTKRDLRSSEWRWGSLRVALGNRLPTVPGRAWLAEAPLEAQELAYQGRTETGHGGAKPPPTTVYRQKVTRKRSDCSPKICKNRTH